MAAKGLAVVDLGTMQAQALLPNLPRCVEVHRMLPFVWQPIQQLPCGPCSMGLSLVHIKWHWKSTPPGVAGSTCHRLPLPGCKSEPEITLHAISDQLTHQRGGHVQAIPPI